MRVWGLWGKAGGVGEGVGCEGLWGKAGGVGEGGGL